MSQRDSSKDPNSQRRKTPQKVKKMIGNYSYDLSEKIGSGFSSSVYRGINNITNQTVAIKVIDLHQITTPISKTLLKNEIHVLRQINHPNLLKVHDIYLTQNNTYIITEFCDQGDLADLIHKYKRLDQRQAFNLLRQILSGMRALQQQQILHRDIKPANILMSNGVPKLADFGFAVCQNQQLDQSILKNFNVGTPLYMAPETILYNQYSEKSDIWALGVVLYEMLHGFPPYKAPSDSSLLNLYLTTPFHLIKFPIGRCQVPHIQYADAGSELKVEIFFVQDRYSIEQVQEFLDPSPVKQLPTIVKSTGKQQTAQFRSTEYLHRQSRDSSPFLVSQQTKDNFYPAVEEKKTYFRSITPQNREFRKVPDGAHVPQPLARRPTPPKMAATQGRSISPINQYQQRGNPQSYRSEQGKILQSTEQPKDDYNELINRYKKQHIRTDHRSDKVESKPDTRMNSRPDDVLKPENKATLVVVTPQNGNRQNAFLSSRVPSQTLHQYSPSDKLLTDYTPNTKVGEATSDKKQPVNLETKMDMLLEQKFESLEFVNRFDTKLSSKYDPKLEAKLDAKLDQKYDVDFDKGENIEKKALLEQITSFQERLGETQREYEREETKKLGKGLQPGDRVILLLCKFLQRLAEKLDNYLQRQSSSSPPSYSDQRSILIMKCTFLFWKCMAIKAFQLSRVTPEQTKQIHQQFLKRYQQMLASSYLTAMMEGDRRFEVLFDEQVEDDCSGFYAILTHYVGELVKSQIKQLLKSIGVEDALNTDLIQTAKLMDKLVTLHQVLQDHLKHLGDIPTFAKNCTEMIENGLIEDKLYLNEQGVTDIIKRAKTLLRIS